MREFVTEKVKQIKPSGIRKFFDVVSEMPDAISLGVGERVLILLAHSGCRNQVIKSRKNLLYFKCRTDGASRRNLLVIPRKNACFLWPWNLNVFISVGGSEAIDIAFRATLDIGDEVIIPEPAFVSYVPCARLAGAVPVTIPLKMQRMNFVWHRKN